ncbi:hypothetical protein ZHAS_00012703 [Anopheles sinensis]|uniref:Uncharacterized protein n=1 Tax=Anopheles sinensis TaxID=74873 RepID=A0A084W3I5_ANOSI|nr:hypothetical protein ZHAS_00012703 [Anopheles sinensis]
MQISVRRCSAGHYRSLIGTVKTVPRERVRSTYNAGRPKSESNANIITQTRGQNRCTPPRVIPMRCELPPPQALTLFTIVALSKHGFPVALATRSDLRGINRHGVLLLERNPVQSSHEVRRTIIAMVDARRVINGGANGPYVSINC